MLESTILQVRSSTWVGSVGIAFSLVLGCSSVAQRLEGGHSASRASVPKQPALVEPAEPTLQSESAAAREPPEYFATLVQRAAELAEKPERPVPKAVLPAGLRAIDYDAYRSIRFRPERSLWRGGEGEFEVQFFHPGFYFQEVVQISELYPEGPKPVGFSTDLFFYDRVPTPPIDAALAFTGFRLHAPVNTEAYKDELIAFQGASYFRPLGKGSVYGLSARGLAIDTGAPTPEEFPRFSEFFLVPPTQGQSFVWVLALLESRRSTGAYAFRIQRGELTTIEVTAEIFLREAVSVLGIAPLTSMYLFGEDQPNRFGDFRPEVHDSDGLSMWAETGEWIHRPLRNPPRTTVSSFRLGRPRGFGLVQRDRDFQSFQDLEARYQDRPSIWIQPLAGFEQGSLRLLEVATELETDDNVAVAFIPDAVPEQKLSIRYRMHVGGGVPIKAPGARVVATRIAKTKEGTRFLVDFAGGQLGSQKDVQVVVSAQNGKVVEQHVEHNPFSGGYRASFEVVPERGAREVELRSFMKGTDDVLSETWSYLWQPTS